MLVSPNLITISFLQKKEDKFINQATYSKMARGKFADFMIKNKIDSVEELYSFDIDGYRHNIELSNNTTIVFTRE